MCNAFPAASLQLAHRVLDKPSVFNAELARKGHLSEKRQLLDRANIHAVPVLHPRDHHAAAVDC
jgi:hypothetical protein